MIKLVGSALVGTALFLDTLSYWKQLVKVIKLRHSNQVSTSAYLCKICKAFCAMVGLIAYANWVGLYMEIFMCIVYVVSLVLIAKYKPKGWTLFS